MMGPIGIDRTGHRRGAKRRAALFRAALGVVLLSAALPVVTASATPDVASPAAVDAVETGAIGPMSAAIIERERRRAQDDLQTLSGTIELSTEAVRSLDAEIAALSADQGRIRQAMIDAAARQKEISRSLEETGARISELAGEEGTIKASLIERRGLLSEVLAALERMGRKPPPALLVKPEDALGSVRSAILLGSVVPSIRDETRRLLGDLERLAAVRSQIVGEKERYAKSLLDERSEEARLGRLFEEKERLEASSREKRLAEAERAAELASKAGDLKDLIASLQRDADAARAAEDEARRRLAVLRQRDEDENRLRLEAEAKAERERLAAAEAQAPAAPEAPLSADDGERQVAALEPAPDGPEAANPGYDLDSLRRDLVRLGPTAAFSTMKGRLSSPVAGRQLIGFGRRDDIGRQTTGATFAARAGDVVTAPSDANVLYSGPFRSYGQLLILDAGDGYHVVLAGMDRIDVEVGQFVSAGEPVAVMGDRRLASVAGADFEASDPALYVEFRKDGKPVDPSPWWTKGPSGRTRNDS